MNALFIRALITEKCVECVSFEKCVECARSNHAVTRGVTRERAKSENTSPVQAQHVKSKKGKLDYSMLG